MHTGCVSDVENMIPRVDPTCGESFPQTLSVGEWGILIFLGFRLFDSYPTAADGAENVSTLGLILKF